MCIRSHRCMYLFGFGVDELRELRGHAAAADANGVLGKNRQAQCAARGRHRELMLIVRFRVREGDRSKEEKAKGSYSGSQWIPALLEFRVETSGSGAKTSAPHSGETEPFLGWVCGAFVLALYPVYTLPVFS